MKEKTVKSDIKKLRKNRQFLTILILLFVSVLFWIFVSILSSQKKEAISPELKLLSKPLTPNIDIATVEKIEQKSSYSQSDLSSFTIYKILSSRDGKNERVVPLEVTSEDLEPKENPAPTQQPRGLGSLLQSDSIDATESSNILQIPVDSQPEASIKTETN